MFAWVRTLFGMGGRKAATNRILTDRAAVTEKLVVSAEPVKQFLTRFAQALSEQRAELKLSVTSDRFECSSVFEGHDVRMLCTLVSARYPFGLGQDVIIDGVHLPFYLTGDFSDAFKVELERRYATTQELAEATKIRALADTLAPPGPRQIAG